MIKTTASEKATRKFGTKLAKLFSGKDIVVCVFGEIGAGKTALIKGILRGLGVKEVVSSPTFTLVKTYEAKKNIINHFDLYRIDNKEELVGIGFDELISKNINIIEWPEVARIYLPKNYYEIKIKKIDDQKREFAIREVAD